MGNVQAVGNWVSIYNNQKLNSLSGLNGIQTIGSYLYIQNNKIKDLTGLTSLSSISGDFTLQDLPFLESLDVEFKFYFFFNSSNPQTNNNQKKKKKKKGN